MQITEKFQTSKESEMQYLGIISKKDRMISIHLQVKQFSITVIQVYAPTTNAKEAEVEQHQKKDVLFILVDWNAKVGV